MTQKTTSLVLTMPRTLRVLNEHVDPGYLEEYKVVEIASTQNVLRALDTLDFCDYW